eukprot:TRINITY_DN1634_c1_g1_i1.p1 TRINITY_DN1634_c1_g1~~TRINITY_DN1634_c1_g1_i1.p1  ORF type:complete len:107 (+),score=10.70 TRINITY_DN1634_c1_g1_i1:47-367(+)
MFQHYNSAKLAKTEVRNRTDSTVTGALNDKRRRRPYSFRVTIQKVLIDIPSIGHGLSLDYVWKPTGVRIKLLMREGTSDEVKVKILSQAEPEDASHRKLSVSGRKV